IELFDSGSFVELERVAEVAERSFCDVAVGADEVLDTTDERVYLLPSGGSRSLADAVRLLDKCERRHGKRYWATIVAFGGAEWLTEESVEALRVAFGELDTQIAALMDREDKELKIYAFRADTMRRLSLLCSTDRGPCPTSWEREGFCVKRVKV
ncbi:MAG: hypothetical protein IKC92_01185, partial [Tidjanibacter sp.]|nr:hypothetical protein [Tidjanibacter sp.]